MRLLTYIPLIVVLSGGCLPFGLSDVKPDVPQFLFNGKQPKNSKEWRKAAEYHKDQAVIATKRAERAEQAEAQGRLRGWMWASIVIAGICVVLTFVFTSAWKTTLSLAAGFSALAAVLKFVAWLWPYLWIVWILLVAAAVLLAIKHWKLRDKALKQVSKGIEDNRGSMGAGNEQAMLTRLSSAMDQDVKGLIRKMWGRDKQPATDPPG